MPDQDDRNTTAQRTQEMYSVCLTRYKNYYRIGMIASGMIQVRQVIVPFFKHKETTKDAKNTKKQNIIYSKIFYLNKFQFEIKEF